MKQEFWIDKTSPICVVFVLVLIGRISEIQWCYTYEAKVEVTGNEVFSFHRNLCVPWKESGHFFIGRSLNKFLHFRGRKFNTWPCCFVKRESIKLWPCTALPAIFQMTCTRITSKRVTFADLLFEYGNPGNPRRPQILWFNASPSACATGNVVLITCGYYHGHTENIG